MHFSGPIREAIYAMGFRPGIKRGKEFIPNRLSKEDFPACLRAIFDGDGSFWITKSTGRLNCKITCSNVPFLEDIHRRLKEYGIVKGGFICKDNTTFKLVFGLCDTLAIGEYIYKDETICLKRKKEIFLKGKQRGLKKNVFQNITICSVEGCNNFCECNNLCAKHYDALYRKTSKRKEYTVNYYRKNKEKHNKQMAVWRDENREHINKQCSEYYYKNREKILAKAKEKRKQKKIQAQKINLPKPN